MAKRRCLLHTSLRRNAHQRRNNESDSARGKICQRVLSGAANEQATVRHGGMSFMYFSQALASRSIRRLHGTEDMRLARGIMLGRIPVAQAKQTQLVVALENFSSGRLQ
jgi:hypothetical protein